MTRLNIKTAVYIILREDNKILFLRRFNTGWCDGYYTLPSGHIDEGELPLSAAVRELREEVDVEVVKNDLKFAHVSYERDTYIDFYFMLEAHKVNPKLNEPDRADKLIWVEIDKLNTIKIVPKVKLCIERALSNNAYSQIDRGVGN